jgi:hypothetical protein
MNWKIITFFFLILAVACTSNKKKAKAIANGIIIHLEEYRKNNGTYPDSLQRLIPQYYHSLPLTGYASQNDNDGFYYQRSNVGPTESYFELYYFAPLGVEVRYDSRSKTWMHDD